MVGMGVVLYFFAKKPFYRDFNSNTLEKTPKNAYFVDFDPPNDIFKQSRQLTPIFFVENF